ncbi:hypothetical protein DMB95_06995 [Campylobacter sp. MIT 12-8780]|uniref:hypothetical protein n=1 Tax=unclassified Campylobacter TaxID=2593542 RepID=UPI00115DC71D|nr:MULTISPECIES: hypothetical protein [unclassified Campylobacter]NDJ27710.1 hypothetical protein [Campylobacter sp. MIT 19-121]TQR40872.1 hypothetical protein DMB95_06995 [Campylobacter sp. MIT 12-8780]
MNYCKYENTFNDIERLEIADRVEAYELIDKLSPREARFCAYVIELCKKIADNYSDEDIKALKNKEKEQ